jgi:hypothetical protein
MTALLQRCIAGVLVCLLAGSPLAAAADSSIQELVAKTVAIPAGSTATFEVGVTSSDTTIWNAGTYTVQLLATDPSGTLVASTDALPGDDSAIPGQTTFLFLSLPIPMSFLGPLNVIARLKHGGTVDDSVAVGIVVGATTLANTEETQPVSQPAAGQPPPSGATPIPGAQTIPGQPGIPGQPPQPVAAATTAPVATAAPSAAPAPAAAPAPTSAPKISGTLANNDAYGNPSAQSGTLNLSGVGGGNTTYTASGGLSTTTGAGKPVVNIQTQYVLMQVGTFSPSFDKDVFAGVSGTGVDYKRVWDPAHTLQFAFISGDHATINPYQIEAVSYGFPLSSTMPFEVTGGLEQVTGPVQTGQYFVRDGEFLGAGLVGKPTGTTLTYELHYGVTDYLDALTDTQRFDSVLDLALGFMLNKVQFSFGYVRAGAYFANLSAPSVKPDNEAETASITAPLGVLQAQFSVNGYHDDLPGSSLQQETNFWTESASLTYPFPNGDSLALQSANGIQHQTGDPSAPFSGNDNTSLAYTTKRGPYAVQLSLTSTNQRGNTDSFMHVITDAITVSRAPFAGLTLTAGYNLVQNNANVASSTSIMSGANASLTYVVGPVSFATQITHSLTHPFVGMSTSPSTTYNYGLTIKPNHSPYSMSGTVTENVGQMNSATGALNLNYQL